MTTTSFIASSPRRSASARVRAIAAIIGVVVAVLFVATGAAAHGATPVHRPGVQVTAATVVPADPRARTASLWSPLTLSVHVVLRAGTKTATLQAPRQLLFVAQHFTIAAQSGSNSDSRVTVTTSSKQLVLRRESQAGQWKAVLQLTVWLDTTTVVAGRTARIGFGAAGPDVRLSVPVAAAVPVDRRTPVASGGWSSPASQDHLGARGSLSWNVQGAVRSRYFETTVHPAAGHRIDCASVQVSQGEPYGAYAALVDPQPLAQSSVRVECSPQRLHVSAYRTNTRLVAEVTFTSTPTKNQARYRVTGVVRNESTGPRPVSAYIDRYPIIGAGASLSSSVGAQEYTIRQDIISGRISWSRFVLPALVVALVVGRVWVASIRRRQLTVRQ